MLFINLYVMKDNIVSVNNTRVFMFYLLFFCENIEWFAIIFLVLKMRFINLFKFFYISNWCCLILIVDMSVTQDLNVANLLLLF